MKNILMILGGLLVGYGGAYLSFKKNIAPFKMDHGGNKMGASLSTPLKRFGHDVAKMRSANYGRWASSLQKDPKGQSKNRVTMGGVLKNGFLTSMLAALNGRDAYYLYGMDTGSTVVHMMFLAEPSVDTEDGVDTENTVSSETPTGPVAPIDPWVDPCAESIYRDTCGICPPICPTVPWGPVDVIPDVDIVPN